MAHSLPHTPDGGRFASAFEAVGVEDERDLYEIDDELMNAIHQEVGASLGLVRVEWGNLREVARALTLAIAPSQLISQGAKLLHLQRLRRAVAAVAAVLDPMTELKLRLSSGEPILRPTSSSLLAVEPARQPKTEDPMAELMRKLKRVPSNKPGLSELPNQVNGGAAIHPIESSTSSVVAYEDAEDFF
ncbi:MAG: hypothetical protein SGPRY_013612 [Prymnesium sp.]